MLNAHQLATRFGLVIGLTAIISGLGVSNSRAQSAVGLGTAGSFAVLGGQTVTNVGPTTIFGNLGVNPGSAVTGFPPGLINNGTIHLADGLVLQAENDLVTAYNGAAGQAFNQDLTGKVLGGSVPTLNPGVYKFNSSAQLTGALVLNAQGNGNAVFIFQISSALTTATGSSVSIINGGSACNVFWQVGSSATIGTTTRFIGNILAMSSITLNTGAAVSPGRALSRNGSVTMDTNNINIGGCSSSTGSWVNDNRVNPQAGDYFASYCDPTAYRVILINLNSTGGPQWSIPFVTLIAAGPNGASNDFGKYGVFSIAMDSKGYFHAALNGGVFNSNGQGSGAKDDQCTVPTVNGAATVLPATGYVPSMLPNFQPALVSNTSRQLVWPSGKTAPIVESYRAGNSWSVDNLGSAIGHLEGTSWLDDAGGNIVLIGHVNDVNGRQGPFGNLYQAQSGDVFTLQDGARRVIYHVTTVSYVAPDAMQVISPDGQRRITLITCSDWGAASGESMSFRKRLVVVAVAS